MIHQWFGTRGHSRRFFLKACNGVGNRESCKRLLLNCEVIRLIGSRFVAKVYANLVASRVIKANGAGAGSRCRGIEYLPGRHIDVVWVGCVIESLLLDDTPLL